MIHYFTTNGIGNAWVANELSIMHKNKIPFRLHAMTKPSSTYHKAAWARELNAGTVEIYPMPVLGTLISIALGPFQFHKFFFEGLLNALFGKRETIRSRIACLAHFFVACHWARLNRNELISHVHSQWAHSCCSIAMYAAWLLDKPFSFTGHGTDLWRDRVALEDKIKRAVFVVCISNFHRELYLKHGARPEQLHIVYCGIDVKQFSPPLEESRPKDDIIHIRASGRLVEKKGFIYLIEACKILHLKGVAFECTIAGSGPMENSLRESIEKLELSGQVTLTGEALKQEDIAEFMHSGTVYCLPCVWASDNDADGLPQMLMEAMACGLPVISTRIVGIPDLVVEDKTGVLVAPNNAQQLASAIERLSADTALSEILAKQGRSYIIERFELEKALRPLVRLFKRQLDSIYRG